MPNPGDAEKSARVNSKKSDSIGAIKSFSEASTKDPSSDEESEEEIVVCCLCHCAADYADREAFFGDETSGSSTSSSKSAKTSESKDATQNENQNLLPMELYDPHNNLVFCDSCDRAFHQKCHFVPLISLPHGGWECLICRFARDYRTKTSTLAKHTSRQRSLTNAQLQQIFQSPPIPDMEELEQIFEEESRHLKAQLWRRELTKRLPSTFQQQLSNIRQGENTLRAYTSTHRARQFLSKKSQELSQTLCKLAAAKSKIRSLFLSVDRVRLGGELDWDTITKWLKTQPEKERIKLFPYGSHHGIRIPPRFENQETVLKQAHKSFVPVCETAGGVPCQVVIEKGTTEATEDSKAQSENQVAQSTDDNEDDDDMISLDDLKCCVCFNGDSTDENDLLLCDGEGCFRAYHMHCLSPHVSPEEAQDEDADWFCPMCQQISKSLFDVQAEYMGHDWEERHHDRYHGPAKADHQDEDSDDDDDDTVKSWAHVGDVFPRAEKELEIATRWEKGKRDAETDALISSVLGVDIGDSGENGVETVDSDDEDSDDDDFDLEAFQNRKQTEQEDANSSVSSDATLKDMSSVEYEVERDELDALSTGSGIDDGTSEIDSEASSQPTRRRLRRSTRSGRDTSDENTDSEPSSKPDIGTLDESNIVRGKRNRKKVDYRSLNNAMFGWIGDEEAVKLFDDKDDEFQVRESRKRAEESDSEDARQSSKKRNRSHGRQSSSSVASIDESKPPRKRSKTAKASGNDESSSPTDTSAAAIPHNRHGNARSSRKTRPSKTARSPNVAHTDHRITTRSHGKRGRKASIAGTKPEAAKKNQIATKKSSHGENGYKVSMKPSESTRRRRNRS